MQTSDKNDIEGLRDAIRVLTPNFQTWIGAALDELVSLRTQAYSRPIYQLRLANGDWRDQTEKSYLYNQQHCALDTRIVYTAPPAQATQDQAARGAIDGAIAFGRMGVNEPEEGHWLTEYWAIGQQLAEFGKTSAWDNQTAIAASAPGLSEDVKPRVLKLLQELEWDGWYYARNGDGTPCCPVCGRDRHDGGDKGQGHTADCEMAALLAILTRASAATVAEPSDQFEHLDLQNHQLRRAMQKMMARLTELLDEDKFAEIEAVAVGAGVVPPEAAHRQAEPGADEREEFEREARRWGMDLSGCNGVYTASETHRAWYMWRRAYIAAQSDQRAGAPENDPYCPRCKGHGEETAMSNNGPDAEELTIACQHCGGEGSLAEAYKGVAKLLAEEQKKYLEACGKLWFERHGDAGQRAGVAEVAVGEEWYARLPHASALIHCFVRDVTAETVLLRDNDYTEGVRYLRSDVTFIERIAAAPTQQQEGGDV